MTEPSLATRLEAILYLKGRPIAVGELSELAGVPRSEVEQALLQLSTSYSQRETALEIVSQNGRYGLQLRAGLGDLVRDLLPVNLSTATLRTLATIALKKRILQSELVDLRGSGGIPVDTEIVADAFTAVARSDDKLLETKGYVVLQQMPK